MLLLSVIGFTLSSNAQQLTNEGTDFYVAFPEVYDNANAVFEINISSNTATSGIVEIIGTPFNQPYNVVPGTVTTVVLTSADADITIDETVLTRAIHVTALEPVTVYASTFHNARSEASVCLPVSALASDYMVTTYPNHLKGGIWYQSEFIIVSGDQPADITFIPSCTTEGGIAAGTPTAVHLDPGEVYMVQAQTGTGNDLTGTVVYADNGSDKFAVYNGHIWAYLNYGTCTNQNADPLYEIAYPTQAWGKDHILMITLEQTQNSYRVIAKENGTTFDVDGVATGPVLNAGDVYDGDFTSTDECIMIEANKPIAVTQTMTTGVCSGNGDPSMVVINGNEQMYLDTVTFYAASGGSNLTQYVNVVTRSADTSVMWLNTAPINGWTQFTYDPEYSYKLIQTNQTLSSHTLTTTGCGFLAYAYGMGNPESYFYAAGVRVNSVDDSLSFTNINTSLQGLCDLDSIEFTPFTSGGQVISYDWDFGDGGTSTDQIPVHTYANPGTYDVTLIVQYQCFSDTISDQISVFNSPELTGSHVDVTCYNWGDGSIDNTTTNGTPGYVYTWSPNVGNTEDLSGLDGGIYTVTVTDQNGCQAEATYVVDEPGPIDITLTPAGPFDVTDGTQNLSATPGGGTWDCPLCPPGSLTSGGVFDPAIAGGPATWNVCYTVTIGSCDSTMCMNIQVDTSCAMAAFTNDPTCYGFSDGSFTVNVSGGIGTINFVLTDSAGNAVNQGNSNTANNLGTGWYYINVDDDVCSFSDSVFIDQPDQMVVDLLTYDVPCNGDATGYAVADTVHNFQGPWGQVSYYWAPAPPGGNGIGADTLSGLTAGIYSLTINDDAGCSIQQDFTISEPPPLTFTQLGTEPAYCRVFHYQQGQGVVYAAASGGTPDYDYEWLNVYTLDNTTNTTWGGLNPSLYQITVTDDNGCILQDFVTLDSLNPTADFNATSPQFLDPGILEGTADVDVHFTNQSLYYENPLDPNDTPQFFWHFDFDNNPPGWILSEDVADEFDYTYSDSGTYTVCLIAINFNGCVDTTCKDILVFDKPELVLPNVFTPDGDGTNDMFFFPNIAISEFEAVIVNRWGRTIFEFTDISQGWDGSDPSGSECPDGVYFYTYKAKATNGTDFEGQGNIHLIRKKK